MKRKKVTMLLTISVPHDMPVSDARLEVRTLINEQCFFNQYVEEGEIKVVRCRSIVPEKKKPNLLPALKLAWNFISENHPQEMWQKEIVDAIAEAEGK